MARTSINIPTDILKAINKVRRKDASLTQNKVLLEFARRGIANAEIEQLNDFTESINRLDLVSKNLQTQIENVESKQDRTIELNQGTLLLLRRAVKDLFGERGLEVLKKSKYDLERSKGS